MKPYILLHTFSKFFSSAPPPPRDPNLGGVTPSYVCNHVRANGIFMMAIYLLIWILGNPLRGRKKSRMFQMMLNYL